MCVCVREREREREYCVLMCMCVCVYLALQDYDADTVSDKTLAQLTRIVDESLFTPESIESISEPAALLWRWCTAVQVYTYV